MRSSTPAKKTNKSIILFGPTASGKTALVTGLFSQGYQIVNADSVQVYRHLDIGSAKPSSELMDKIPHHLVDVLDPWQQFTAGSFVSLADKAVAEIQGQGDIPILTGGTAFYFRNYLFGLTDAPTADPMIRQKVQDMLQEKGKEELYGILESVDPVSALRININDEYRITRALEVYYQSGRPLSSFTPSHQYREGINPLIIGLSRDKDVLDSRIKQRVDIMFDEGLVDEIRTLMRMGASLEWPGMQGIGYKEFLTAQEDGCYSLRSIKKAIVHNSIKYAKRQMTFFRSFANTHWVDADDINTIKNLVSSYIDA